MRTERADARAILWGHEALRGSHGEVARRSEVTARLQHKANGVLRMITNWRLLAETAKTDPCLRSPLSGKTYPAIDALADALLAACKEIEELQGRLARASRMNSYTPPAWLDHPDS